MAEKIRPTIKAAFMASPGIIEQVFGAERWESLAQRTDLLPSVLCAASLDAHLDQLAQTEVVFAGWGMPLLLPEHLDRMPRLRAVFYAAGSCQSFARPLLERDILLTSAWQDNAVPVAEFTLAQILLSCKGYWRNVAEYRPVQDTGRVFRGSGSYGETVALLGLGAVGRTVAELLRPFRLQVIAYDPFLDPAVAQRLNVEPVSLQEAFTRGYVVSNHLADNPQTRGLIDASLLRLLRPSATFINTGRGLTVDEPALIDLLRQRPDVMALLDVTAPEPMRLDSPLRTLPNVRVSSHIAGSIGNETGRMADTAIREFERYVRGEPPLHPVTLAMLATMA